MHFVVEQDSRYKGAGTPVLANLRRFCIHKNTY